MAFYLMAFLRCTDVMALARILAVALFANIAGTEAQNNLCTKSNSQRCMNKDGLTPLLIFTSVEKIKLDKYCSDYAEVKDCRSVFVDNCTDAIKKEFDGWDGKMAFICKNNGEDYAKHIDCVRSPQRKKAEIDCYRTYISAQGDVYTMAVSSWSEWRDGYCQHTKTFKACSRTAVVSYCQKDSVVWTDELTRQSLKPMMESLWCPDWTTSPSKIVPTTTPGGTAIQYWLLVAPGLVAAVVTALAIVIVHKLRHRQQDDADAVRDGTRVRTRGEDRIRAQKTRRNAKSQKAAGSRGPPNTRPTKPTKPDHPSSDYTRPEAVVRGRTVYEDIALKPVDREYEHHGPRDKPNEYATLAPDDTYTKLNPFSERNETTGSDSKNDGKKKSRKRKENTYLQLS